MSDESEKSEKSESAFLMESLNATLLSLSQLIQQNKPGNSSQDGLISAMTITLEGKKNFNLWSKMIEMKLSGKDKFGYLDGSKPKPGEKDEACRKWKMEDSLVKDYMINSMHSSLIGNYLPFSSAKEVWDSVNATYFDGDDLTQYLDLVRKVNRVKQAGSSVETYYSQLQGLWRELDVRRPNPMTCPADIEKYNKLVREDRVVTFLDGLEDRLDNVRATILQLRPFPTLEQVFALVNREENRQGVMLNQEIGVENTYDELQ